MLKLRSPTFLFVILCSILDISKSYSQAPAIEWQNTITGSLHDGAVTIEQTPDGGYIIGGRSTSNAGYDKSENILGSGDLDLWIVKTDNVGNIEWENSIRAGKDDFLVCVYPTSDGGYIVGAFSNSAATGDKTETNYGTYPENDFWILKLDSAGTIIWDNTIGGNGDDMLGACRQTPDGGYIIGGYSTSNANGDKTEMQFGAGDYWILKLNAAGVIEWQNTIGGNGYDALNEIALTKDGGYIIAGVSGSMMSADKSENVIGEFTYDSDMWIVKLDSAGNIQWENTIGGSENDNCKAVQQTTDGGYIIFGDSKSGISGDKTEDNDPGGAPYNRDLWVLKLNDTGNILWQNSITGNGTDEAGTVQETTDGCYILAGTSRSNAGVDKSEDVYGYNDFWIIKLDTTGDIIWQNTIGGSAEDEEAYCRQTSDGGYIIGGKSSSDIGVDKSEVSIFSDIWILKLFPDVCATPAGLFTNNITPTKATTHWNLVPGALSYQVWYRVVGAGSWTKKNTGVNFKTLKMLSPETNYEYKVRSKCNGGEFGEFTAVQNFTTLPLREEINSNHISLSIYPNPAIDNLIISINSFITDQSSLIITDISGRIIFTSQLNSPTTEINISDFASGMYFVKIYTEVGEMIEKFIKN